MSIHRGKIRNILKGLPIALAYLHGSCAIGKDDEESDIDIGILADPALSKKERHSLRLSLMQPIAEALGVPMEKLDTVILQDVPVLLQYNIIRGGIILFQRTRAERITYELHVEQMFDDEQYYLSREANTTIRHILSPSL